MFPYRQGRPSAGMTRDPLVSATDNDRGADALAG
jgi:hypothetical protein